MADTTGTGAAQSQEHSQPQGCKKIFLSYTRPEIEQARAIIALLEEAGFEVWWDGLLEGGVTYLATTEAALEGADCVVVLWSQLSVESAWVRDEAQSGRERGCLVPLSLDGTMAPLGFRQIQMLDISAWDGKHDSPLAQRIINAVRMQCDGTPAPVRPVVPAPTRKPLSGRGAPGISRRAMVAGGIGIAAGAAALAMWQGGVFAPGDDATSMAVLRFANLTGQEEQNWFSDGLSNEVRSILARNPLLKVSAPTSSTANEDADDFAIGRSLGVSNILRGSVQLVANTVRVSAELVQVSDGLIVWAQSYDRDFSDILALQSDIAREVASALVPRLTGEEGLDLGGTDDPRAYEAYLRGQSLYQLTAGEESDRAALRQFEAAIAIDPDYAAAHAMRSTMLAAVANATSDADEMREYYAQATAAARRSIAIEPNLARGHLALGFAIDNGKGSRSEALPHYRRAEELAPGDADTQRTVAIFYAYGDQQDLAKAMIERVLELDPLNARAFHAAGFIALFARDWAGVIQRMEEALALNPNLASAQYAIANARLMQGDLAAARASFEAESVPVFRDTGLAIVAAQSGDADKARDLFARLVEGYGDSSLYQQSQVLAHLGDPDAAIAMLERAYDAGDPGVLLARNDPLLDPLRGHPAFERLLLERAT
ncbi:TIR domain-containing protein [Qipengyuania nanhaisediminis]|uniref:TIR domain-containing protein n=1 Tax=Qipengyuania nanhaisediminis TaxID=604088 RepID=UPI0038B3F4AE